MISINKPSIWWCFVFPRKITVRKFWSLRHTEIGNWNYSLTSKNNSKRNTNQVWFITSGATENEKTHNSKLEKSSGRSGGTWNVEIKESENERKWSPERAELRGTPEEAAKAILRNEIGREKRGIRVLKRRDEVIAWIWSSKSKEGMKDYLNRQASSTF